MTAEELARRLYDGDEPPRDHADLERELAAYGHAALDVIERMNQQHPSFAYLGVMRKLHRDDVIPRLAEWATTRHSLRLFAIEALGHGRTRAALEPLLASLDKTLGPAARALGELGFAEAIPELEARWQAHDLDALLADPTDPVVWAVAEVGAALARLGRPGLEGSLGRLFAEADLSAATVAAHGLAWYSTPEAVLALRRSLARPVEAQRDAIFAIGALGLAASAPVLIELAEQQPDCYPLVWNELRCTFGDELPDAHSIAAIRTWWERTEDRWPRHHLWYGGKDLAHALERTVNRDGAEARARIELWTGIDFVDNAKPSPGDAGDLPRAMLWLSRAGGDWDMTAVYRAGRKLVIEPIIEALNA